MSVHMLGRGILSCAAASAIAFQPLPALAQQAAPVSLEVQANRPGAKINRDIFGQFAEHLGSGIYGGIWVGPNSPIPNVRGIRSDVVQALRAIQVPNVRWPGGCFGDNYHWRNGIGPRALRPGTLNPDWGGVIEPNSFGTEEYFDFLGQIGAEAFISENIGSGTVSGSRGLVRIYDLGQADHAGQAARRERPPDSLQDQGPRTRQRELGLRRRDDARALCRGDEALRPLHAQL